MLPSLHPHASLADAMAPSADHDALVVVTARMPPELPEPLDLAVRQILEIDRTLTAGPRVLAAPTAPGRRLVICPVRSVHQDTDDVRRFAEAAQDGMRLARDAGARRPALLTVGAPADPRYDHAVTVAALGALAGLYEPLEARESFGDADAEPVLSVGLIAPPGVDGQRFVAVVEALEEGRRLARDLCGTEPERMAPPRMADLCQDAFAGTDVDVEVVRDPATLAADFPLLMAVARASSTVERHAPRVVRLAWQGDGPVTRTLLIAGKGVSYDTGGADLKTGGHMAGMSRDKGGAAAVAGLVLALARSRPPGLRVVALLGCVRNSVGAEGFVTDEIVVGHSGVRVRVGNTDAEGRLVLADLLSHLRREALDATAPTLLSVATLTGHAALAAGPYTVLVENGPARDARVAAGLAAAGEAWGDPCEVSSLRREDFDAVAPHSRADDVLSCNNKPSSQTPRGHQLPVAFLVVASGLDAHGRRGQPPLPYLHVDIAGSAVEDGDWQHGVPTAAPVLALAAWLAGRRLG